MTTVHHQRRHESSKDLISSEDEVNFQSRTSAATAVPVDELEGSHRRNKYRRSPTSSGKPRRSLSSSRRSGSARSLSSSEKSGSSRSLGSPKQRRRHQSNSRRASKGEGNSSSRRSTESHKNGRAGDLLQSGSNSSSSSAEHFKSRPRTSKSRSRRSLMKDQRHSEEDDLTETTVSTTADGPFLEASDEDLSSKASRVMASPRNKRGRARDSLFKSSHHSQSSKSPSRSITLSSNKRSNDTRSSKEILYGADDDIKAKSKSPRSTMPGVDRLRHSSHHKSSSKMDLLYGDDELKKGKRTSASSPRPGVERVQDTRELLYGDEEAKFKTNRISKSSLSSSTPGVEEVDGDDDDGYSYDFPIASQRREIRSSLTAADDSEDSVNRTIAAVDSVTIVQENKKSKRKLSTLCIICGILFAVLVLVVGVVVGFTFLQRDEETTEAIPGAVNLTSAPNAFATLVPTQVPSTDAPSSPPFALEDFDPPSQEDCTAIGSNGTIPGQEDLGKLYFNIKLDVTLSVHGDISEEAVKELLAALERLFIPTLVGCSEADVGRRMRSRRLASRYVIRNADIMGSVNPEAECIEGTPEPEKCHVVDLELTVYLKGDAPEFDVFSIISEVGRGDLIPLLELPPATFAGVAMSSAGVVIPSDKPSTRPSPSPSASPSAAPSSLPSASPTKAPVVERTPLPTALPSNLPSASASASPSSALSGSPTVQASQVPRSSVPSSAPSQAPVPPLTSMSPSMSLSTSPSGAPSPYPSSAPSLSPSVTPSISSSASPSASPTRCYCTSADACDNTTNDFIIGCGSCDGEGACTSMSQVTMEGGAVGANACQGPGSCNGASIYTIGRRSCTDTSACQDRLIAVDAMSCTAQNSCSAMPVTNDSWNSARTGKLTVGTGSCTTIKACHSYFGTVGSGSCKGRNACSERMELRIGDNACLGAFACSYEARISARSSSAPNGIRVVNNSCQGAYSCQCMTKVLVEGACNVLGECCDSSNPKQYAQGFSTASDLF